jgi:hypothetical protein
LLKTLDQRVELFPSMAFEAGNELFSTEDAVAETALRRFCPHSAWLIALTFSAGARASLQAISSPARTNMHRE